MAYYKTEMRGLSKQSLVMTRPHSLVLLISIILLVTGLSYYPINDLVVTVLKPGSASNIPVISASLASKKINGELINRQATKLPKLALSFDDGPNPKTTPLILDTLEKYNVKASFFVVGSRIKGNEELLQRIHHDGNDIGNHSWSHPNFAYLDKKAITKQLLKTERAVVQAGLPAPFLFRPPYGVVGKNFPKKFPIAIVLWNVDPEDWSDHDAKDISKKIVSQAKPGAIVDLHGIYIDTAKAIGPAIKKLKKHYQLVTVSELMDIKPGDTGKYYGYK